MGTETDPRQPEPHFGCTFVLLQPSPSTTVCSRHDVGRDIRSLSTHNHDVPMLNRTNCNFLYFVPSRQFQEEKAKALQRYRCCHCSSQWPLCRQWWAYLQALCSWHLVHLILKVGAHRHQGPSCQSKSSSRLVKVIPLFWTASSHHCIAVVHVCFHSLKQGIPSAGTSATRELDKKWKSQIWRGCLHHKPSVISLSKYAHRPILSYLSGIVSWPILPDRSAGKFVAFNSQVSVKDWWAGECKLTLTKDLTSFRFKIPNIMPYLRQS